MTLPNFLIIGTQKAGTTALYRYLEQHPEIYMSPDKEPRYFSFSNTSNKLFPYRRLDQYEGLFSDVAGEKAVGEASTEYLASPVAPERIAQTIPHAKLIAILRNPVERAYSAYIFRVREGQEKRNDFARVLQEELDIVKNGRVMGTYLNRGFYGRQIERYYHHFPREQLRLFLFEDLVNDTSGVLREIYRFLGVDEDFSADTSRRYNISEIPGNPLARAIVGWMGRQLSLRQKLQKILPNRVYWSLVVPVAHSLNEKLRTGKSVKPPPMDDESRAILTKFYREDIGKLHSLTGLPVLKWLGEPNGEGE
jgi:hypothetical protein